MTPFVNAPFGSGHVVKHYRICSLGERGEMGELKTTARRSVSCDCDDALAG